MKFPNPYKYGAEVMANTEVTITIPPTKWYRFRKCIGLWILKFGFWFAGISTKINVVDDAGTLDEDLMKELRENTEHIRKLFKKRKEVIEDDAR